MWCSTFLRETRGMKNMSACVIPSKRMEDNIPVVVESWPESSAVNVFCGFFLCGCFLVNVSFFGWRAGETVH